MYTYLELYPLLRLHETEDLHAIAGHEHRILLGSDMSDKEILAILRAGIIHTHFRQNPIPREEPKLPQRRPDGPRPLDHRRPTHMPCDPPPYRPRYPRGTK
jgi:hypothetical protein